MIYPVNKPILKREASRERRMSSDASEGAARRNPTEDGNKQPEVTMMHVEKIENKQIKGFKNFVENVAELEVSGEIFIEKKEEDLCNRPVCRTQNERWRKNWRFYQKEEAND